MCLYDISKEQAMPTSTQLLLIATIALPCSCHAPSLDASAHYGRVGLGGGILADSTSGTAINSWSELGLGGSEGAPGATFDAEWGISHLSISTSQSHFHGSGSISSEIEIDGDTISVGSDVESDLEFGVTSALLTWDLMPAEFDFELGLGVAVLGLDMELQEKLTSTEVNTDETLPIPVLAARVGLTNGPWDAEATLTGLDVDVDGASVVFFNLDAQGRYHLIKGTDLAEGADRIDAYLLLGYRATDLDLEDDQTQISLDLTGPYIGLRMSF